MELLALREYSQVFVNMFPGDCTLHYTWFDTPALNYQNMSMGKVETNCYSCSDRIS